MLVSKEQPEGIVEKIRVLLAEDHVVVREGTRELVQRERDMEVVGEAGDGEEAIELTSKLRPNVVILALLPRTRWRRRKVLRYRFQGNTLCQAWENSAMQWGGW
jgi:CheY-like chemotaxis protein